VLSSEKTIRLGNVHPTRDLNYVGDVCDGFLALAESDKTIGKVFNISSAKEISIMDLAGLIIKLMKSNKKIAKDNERVRPARSEVERLCGDNTLIGSLAGWKPR